MSLGDRLRWARPDEFDGLVQAVLVGDLHGEFTRTVAVD